MSAAPPDATQGRSGQGQAGLPATTEAKLATTDLACVALLAEECGLLRTKAGLLLRRRSQGDCHCLKSTCEAIPDG
jgi:hypothetical protein